MDHYENVAAERKLRTSGSKRRRGWWQRPSSSMASCGWPAARFVVRRRARVTEDGGGVRAADCMLQLPSGKRCPAAWPRLVTVSAPRMASCRCRAGGS
ncbi:hypothetical protein PR003_g17153 [Phytophthora rubi]|uniref:Uncharacterized protein n=1 Tax=Phytophthora rubi TaxID=129364 RepID=A0A6A3K614_9STRA|nr:hypothetical protein PR002_g18473 [Phytophthora rubi]KAE9322715.1 hypothetical protein PR003_g17153 [Phytophthora rubi]